ncbi:MAG: CHRD domain-containing protein [Ktedonobacteraceae bacterium]|nr:CHRD domain-containing protein [Ktedonobacteraceae bacterium]
MAGANNKGFAMIGPIKRTCIQQTGPFLILCLFAVLVSSCAIQPISGETANAQPSVFSMPARIQIALAHSPSGTADLQWSAMSHTLMVTIAVTGLAPKSTHLAHIHTGTCRSLGQIVSTLNPLVADAHGVGMSITMIGNVMAGIPTGRWRINIHNGPTFATGLDARPIACGTIAGVRTTTREVQSAHVILASTISPDENVHGMAQVQRMDQTITVTLSLSGLVPKSMHMAHIHAGTCAAQGPVLFPLQAVVADALGNAMVVTRITGHTLLPQQWYVNVHEAATIAAMMTPQGFLPIACGDGSSLS